jgi:hypothetical protein
MQPEKLKRLEAFLDREELFDLVRRERFARDQRRFDVMRECFHDDAYVRTSWYDGYGGQAYVDATKERMGPSGSSGKHWVFPAYAKIAGDRATIESPATIFSRTKIGDVAAVFHVYCRFFSRAVRQNGDWKLSTFEVLWEHDELNAVNSGETLPLDLELLNSMRPSYRFLGYIQSKKGVKVNLNLLGDDRWEQLEAFHNREDEWLAGGK